MPLRLNRSASDSVMVYDRRQQELAPNPIWPAGRASGPCPVAGPMWVVIRCELVSGSPRESLETDGAAFFGRDSLLALSLNRNTAAQLRRVFDHYDQPTLPTDFD